MLNVNKTLINCKYNYKSKIFFEKSRKEENKKNRHKVS